MGRLTTHVLDTAAGKPAAHMSLTLFRLNKAGSRILVAEHRTNSDGRTDRPLMEGADFHTGTYELCFQVDEYFARSTDASRLAQPPFLDLVTLRFTLAKAEEHYHVPLLVSPWSYSTYRGS